MILGSIRYRYNIDVLIDTKPVSPDLFFIFINYVYKSLADYFLCFIRQTSDLYCVLNTYFNLL